MNIYARFFDHEALTHSTEELIGFLASLDDINMTARLEQEIRDYVEGDMPYPKRYKVKPRIYFILIKTEAETMEQFKANNKSATPKEGTTSRIDERTRLKEAKLIELAEVKKGWYFVKMLFKRISLRYKNDIREIEVQMRNAQESYAMSSASLLQARKETYEEHLAEISEMERLLDDNDPKLMTMIESYRRGFLKGISAITLKFINNE